MILVIIELYFAVCMTLIVHETGHYLCARLFRVEVVAVLLGSELLSFSVKRIRISPLMLGGGVEVTEKSLIECGRLKTSIFFLGGITFNILLFIIFLQHNSFFAFLIKSINALTVLYNISGFWIKDSDIHMLLYYLKSVKKGELKC